MSKEDQIEMKGEVLEACPGATFRVQLDDGPIILGHLAGRLRQNSIKVLVGDKVDVSMSPYDLTKGRIIYRHR